MNTYVNTVACSEESFNEGGVSLFSKRMRKLPQLKARPVYRRSSMPNSRCLRFRKCLFECHQTCSGLWGRFKYGLYNYATFREANNSQAFINQTSNKTRWRRKGNVRGKNKMFRVQDDIRRHISSVLLIQLFLTHQDVSSESLLPHDGRGNGHKS